MDDGRRLETDIRGMLSHLDASLSQKLIIPEAVYQSLLHLSWVDKLLDNVKTLFVDLYSDQLRKPHTSIVECPFDDYFDQQVRELEGPNINRPTTARVKPAPIPAAEASHEAPPPLPGMLQGSLSSLRCKDRC